jgi:hypothetical protein
MACSACGSSRSKQAIDPNHQNVRMSGAATSTKSWLDSHGWRIYGRPGCTTCSAMRHVWVNDGVDKIEVWTDGNHNTFQVRRRYGRDSKVIAVGSNDNFEQVLTFNLRASSTTYPSQIKPKEDATDSHSQQEGLRQESQEGDQGGQAN